MRHAAVIRNLDPGRGVSITTLAYDYPSGFLVSEHAHGSDQLIYAPRGIMEVHSGQSAWIIPPSFALWVPALMLHSIRMPIAVSMRTLYLRPGLVKRSGSECEVLSVEPLLRELIVEAVRIGKLRMRNAEHRAVIDLASLHIARASSIPVEIRMPKEPRALNAATILLKTLADAPSLQTVCRQAGISTRTLQRLFKNDVGTDAQAWRHQVRLARALEHLLGGSSVKQAAFAVGYNQPSAFVVAFRRTFGITPKAWTDNVVRSKSR